MQAYSIRLQTIGRAAIEDPTKGFAEDGSLLAIPQTGTKTRRQANGAGMRCRFGAIKGGSHEGS
jgi:hypothetical protein